MITPLKSLNKAYRRQKVNRPGMDAFRVNLKKLLGELDEQESEENVKNDVIAFLKDTWYKDDFVINTKDRTDLVIHTGKSKKTNPGVLMEVKRPTNKSEMISKDNMNAKAMQELVLYYLQERVDEPENRDIKHIIVTNVYEWFIFKSDVFYDSFFKNHKLVKDFKEWSRGQKDSSKRDMFYKDIAGPAIEAANDKLEFTYLDLRDIGGDEKKEIPAFKLLSPVHLLNIPFANDSNSLNKQFYHELLHIIGLEEVKEKGKKVIQRKGEEKRNQGSLLENAINIMDEGDRLRLLNRPSHFGESLDQRLYNVALELCITWINRILFLKLLESQLVAYNKGDTSFRFLDSQTVPNFDALDGLFFGVLARKTEDRSDRLREKFGHVPYLNSSLFEQTGLEGVLTITQLNNNLDLELYSQTVLKNEKGKRLTGSKDALSYLFAFLEAYDFSSEGKEEIQEENKSLINASVLGLIFEKINGYKDGSFYTPGFITMYMCRETIRRAVVQKFNESKGLAIKEYDELYDVIDDKKEANEIINSLKICDPAVGSGHFLVSALNEIIAIKADLKILLDREGKTLRDYDVSVENDELIVTDDNDHLFQYAIGSKEKQRIQETLFHEKQTIIENCLFGVDINPNSVKICRLRLWIELLKNAYYKNEKELETLPNIDINIKTGNSLISRFDLDSDISQALKKSKWDIGTYRGAVNNYKNATNKEDKRQFEKLIDDIKNDFETEINKKDTRVLKLNKLKGELTKLTTQTSMFEMRAAEKKKWKKDTESKTKAVTKLESELEEIKSNKIYEDAFEWRFEFPEVLDEKGNFKGFDVVIGNPPYFSVTKIPECSDYFSSAYQSYVKGTDVYCLFFELGIGMLKASGVLTYITSNSWIRAKYGDELKKYFEGSFQPRVLVNVEDIQLFDEATVESNILIGEAHNLSEEFQVVNMMDDYEFGSSIGRYVSSHSMKYKPETGGVWRIEKPEVLSLMTNIENDSQLLKDFSIEINRGFLTGLNEAFIIDQETRDDLVAQDSNNDVVIKPILRGRDLHKYGLDFNNFYVINSHNGLKEQKIPRIDLQADFPKLFDHLSRFQPKIEKRFDQGDHWSNLRNCAYLPDFEKPKIVWGEISDKPKFAYDDMGYYAEATSFIMVGEDLKFLLAILNSRLSEWYFKQIGTTTGMGTNRWKKYKIELLPVRKPDNTTTLRIESLVEEIIRKNGVGTTELESQIDKLVYELYGLTDEEIMIVEGGVNG